MESVGADVVVAAAAFVVLSPSLAVLAAAPVLVVDSVPTAVAAVVSVVEAVAPDGGFDVDFVALDVAGAIESSTRLAALSVFVSLDAADLAELENIEAEFAAAVVVVVVVDVLVHVEHLEPSVDNSVEEH